MGSEADPPKQRLRPFAFFFFAVVVVLFTVGLQWSEQLLAEPVAGASWGTDVPKAAEKAIDLYVEIAKSLLSFAVAAIGGLAYLVSKDLEAKVSPTVWHLVSVTLAFLVLMASIFYGVLAIQFIADSLARDVAFATQATVGHAVDDRFRSLLRMQFGTFALALSILMTEVLRRLATHGVVTSTRR